MKILKALTLVCLTLVCLTTFAQKPKWEKANFKVSGNCDMCKTKIETAAKGIEGVKKSKMECCKWKDESKI